VKTVSISCVVEGHGETESLPIILRRIPGEKNLDILVKVDARIRIPKSRLLRTGELERAIELAARRLEGTGLILVLIDADEDCPKEVIQGLRQRVEEARSDVPTSVVLAKMEFEGWFLASAESLRGYRGLPNNLSRPPEPEDIRGAKEWLSDQMAGTYSSTVDQPAFASRFNFGEAETYSRSFRKLLRDIELIASQIDP